MVDKLDLYQALCRDDRRMQVSFTIPAIAILAILCFQFQGRVCAAPGMDKVAAQMSTAAQDVIDTLTPAQKRKCVRKLNGKARVDWHFIPTSKLGIIRSRTGLAMKDMNAEQQAQVLKLLEVSLSLSGFQVAEEIRHNDNYLIGQRNFASGTLEAFFGFVLKYGEGNYHICFYGTPGEPNWAWRFEGHHFEVDFSIVGGKLVSRTPASWGSNHVIKSKEYPNAPDVKTKTLSEFREKAHDLLMSFNESKRDKAIIASKPLKDVQLVPRRSVETLLPQGLAAAEMNRGEKQNLRRLLDAYIQKYRSEIATLDWEKIEAADFDQVHFAWAGSLDRGGPTYYRIQGPSFVLEFDNPRFNADHIHTVWRSKNGGDFGRDVLAEHYRRHKHGGQHSH